MSTLLINGNAKKIPLADNSIHCAVTSPPYWRLRNYGVSNQLGAESTPDEYIANLVEVFRDLRRVLRPDGTLFLNIGDVYYNGRARKKGHFDDHNYLTGATLKPKDLVGLPFWLAFALRADGWWLRVDAVWEKPNQRPENVRDRPTRSHEYVFMLTKSQNYYYDAFAVREQGTSSEYDRTRRAPGRMEGNRYLTEGAGYKAVGKSFGTADGTRNMRSVWSITTKGYKGAHFATFPVDLVLRCIKAGTSEAGCCPICGAPWVRVLKKVGKFQRRWSTNNAEGSPYNSQDSFQYSYETDGWQQICACRHDTPVPCVVLDPFVGSGTTVLAARELGHHGIGLDLNFSYVHDLAVERLAKGLLKKKKAARPKKKWEQTELPLAE